MNQDNYSDLDWKRMHNEEHFTDFKEWLYDKGLETLSGLIQDHRTLTQANEAIGMSMRAFANTLVELFWMWVMEE